MSCESEKGIDKTVCQLAKDLLNLISREDIPKHDLQKVFDTVGELLDELDKGLLVEKFPNTDINLLKENYQRHHYSRLLQTLVGLFSLEWIKALPDSQEGFSLEDIFMKGVASETFYILCKSVTDSSHGYLLNKCVSLLEKFLQQNKLSNVICSQCGGCVLFTKGEISANRQSHHVDHYVQQQWEQIITYIVTLPERVTNKLQGETGLIFYPESYIPLVCIAILNSLEKVQSCLQRDEACSLEFVSHLLGKLCISGHGDSVWSKLLPELMVNIENESIWCRICERLVCSVPDKYLESVIIPLIQHIKWYGHMAKFLGHSVIESRKVKFLLTNKLLLLRYFKKHRILQNILGYLSESATIKPLFFKTVIKLLEVWGDKSALKHTSYEQHLYITKAVLVSTAFMNEKDCKQIEEEIIQKLMIGVQIHLDSSLPNIRRQGMIVAEGLTAKVNIQVEKKLTFEYDSDDESKELKNLLVPPKYSGVDYIQEKLESTHIKKQAHEDSSTLVEGVATNKSTEELDSDDDLEPYDLSNDRKMHKEKPPHYIRECLDGLISSSENPDRFECCLEVTEKLIKQHSTAAKEVAVELAKVLLHLQDNFALPNFVIWRHRSLVAILVVAPIKTAEYLTVQFYERNYNIRQRLDILEVLCSAAKELSNPGSEKTSEKNRLIVEEKSKERVTETEHWKDVVQRRIDSKTRRFASSRQSHEIAAVKNRFSPVAGSFFFPLLTRFDSKENTLDLLGEDHLVLSRLIYTLGVIIYQAQHSPVCRNMGKALLEFIWVLRYHPQPSVRQSLLFSSCMVLLAVPPHILLEDLQPQVLETKTWLQDIADKDTDRECQKIAVQALIVMENVVKQQFSSELQGVR